MCVLYLYNMTLHPWIQLQLNVDRLRNTSLDLGWRDHIGQEGEKPQSTLFTPQTFYNVIKSHKQLVSISFMCSWYSKEKLLTAIDITAQVHAIWTGICQELFCSGVL